MAQDSETTKHKSLRYCYVPFCRSGYQEFTKELISQGKPLPHFFRPPNQEMAKIWDNIIRRKSKPLTIHDRVCSLHFRSQDIQVLDEIIVIDGDIYKEPKARVLLRSKNVIPSILEGYPSFYQREVRRKILKMESANIIENIPSPRNVKYTYEKTKRNEAITNKNKALSDINKTVSELSDKKEHTWKRFKHTKVAKKPNYQISKKEIKIPDNKRETESEIVPCFRFQGKQTSRYNLRKRVLIRAESSEEEPVERKNPNIKSSYFRGSSKMNKSLPKGCKNNTNPYSALTQRKSQFAIKPNQSSKIPVVERKEGGIISKSTHNKTSIKNEDVQILLNTECLRKPITEIIENNAIYKKTSAPKSAVAMNNEIVVENTNVPIILNALCLQKSTPEIIKENLIYQHESALNTQPKLPKKTTDELNRKKNENLNATDLNNSSRNAPKIIILENRRIHDKQFTSCPKQWSLDDIPHLHLPRNWIICEFSPDENERILAHKKTNSQFDKNIIFQSNCKFEVYIRGIEINFDQTTLHTLLDAQKLLHKVDDLQVCEGNGQKYSKKCSGVADPEFKSICRSCYVDKQGTHQGLCPR